MSLTSKQIDELRAYAKDRKGELAKLIMDAADTIETLSAKLHASQMERSSQYYHGGWIPVSERLPKIGIDVLFTVKVNGCKWVAEGCHRVDGRWWHYFMNRALEYDKVTAWMPLPEPYRGEGEK